MRIDHVGYAVRNIERSKSDFEDLGFTFEEIVTDTDRNIYICFGENDGYRIELIQPMGTGETPVDLVLENNGPTPYHICYITDNIDVEIDRLAKRHYVLSSPPAEAVAFNKNKVAFLYKAKVGLIELVEQ